MLSITPQNTTDYKITVTNSAKNYFDLVDTASGTTNARTYYTQKFANALQITPEGDIRYLAGATPTATLGTPLSAGTTYYLPGVSLDEFQFISQGGNVTVQAVPYKSEPGESPAAVAFDVTLEVADIEIGAVEIKDGASDTRAAVTANNELNTLSSDFLLEIEQGNVPGHSLVDKFGKNPDIQNASTFESVWNGGGAYTGFNATAAEVVEVFSSSGNDAGVARRSGSTATGGSATTLVDTAADFTAATAVAVGDVIINDTQQDHAIVTVVAVTTLTTLNWAGGTIPVNGDVYRVASPTSTGTPVVKLKKLLDSSWTENSEYIIMNGVTGVDTTGSYLRCSRGRCHGLDNVGSITARQKVTTANIFMVLPIGYNSTMIAADTIPAGKTGYILDWFMSLAGKTGANVDLRLKAAEVNDVFQVQEEQSIMGAGSSSSPRPFRTSKGPYPEMSDILIEASSDTNSTAVVAGFTLLLIDN